MIEHRILPPRFLEFTLAAELGRHSLANASDSCSNQRLSDAGSAAVREGFRSSEDCGCIVSQQMLPPFEFTWIVEEYHQSPITNTDNYRP